MSVGHIISVGHTQQNVIRHTPVSVRHTRLDVRHTWVSVQHTRVDVRNIWVSVGHTRFGVEDGRGVGVDVERELM